MPNGESTMPHHPPLSFVAIDFETANQQRASVCQVGLVKVIDGKIVEEKDWLVIPPTGVDSFSATNVAIHGIRPAKVRRHGIAWEESFRRINAFAEGLPFIAHNSTFDRSVYEAATTACGLTVPTTRWEDTVGLARRYLVLNDYKLPTVAREVGAGRFAHHDAAADARACAKIALGVAARENLTSMDALWPARGKSISPTWADRSNTARVSELPQPDPAAPADHPLQGHRVVLTGQLEGMTRWETFETIAAGGGQPQKNVTLKTTLLVVADYESLPPTSALGASKKTAKALEYQQRGTGIRLIGAAEFRQMLEGPPVEDETQPQEKAPEAAETVETDTPALPEPLEGEQEEREREAPSVAPASPLSPATTTDALVTTPEPGGLVPQPFEPNPGRLAPTSPERSVPTHQPRKPKGIFGTVFGWVLLIGASLTGTLWIAMVTFGLITDFPGPAVAVAVLFLSLLVLAVLAALGFWGAWLIWLRHRRSRVRS